jgi:hypothetical protein
MSRSPSLLAVLFVPCCFAALPASAGTVTWSGPASPCGATLQACINGAASGDVIEVATNAPIHEDLTIGKSLELLAAPGFSPVLADLRAVLLTNPGALSNRIRFEGFTLTRGRVAAVQGSSGTFDVGIRFVTVLNTFSGLSPIEVRTGSPGAFGPVQAGIVGNRITIPANSQPLGARAISLEGGNASSLLGLIQGNRIDHFDGGQDGAIGVFNVDAPLDVSVVANEIRGADYNDGVLFFQFGNGSARVRFLDNLVVGQTTQSGVPGSYVMLVDGGDATFEIVNNTAAEGANGILVLGRDDLGASWSGIVANNVVAGMGDAGIVIGQPTLTAGVVDNDHNLVFDVAANNFVPGPGTLFADPSFAGGGDYRLTDASPARNAGNDARVPLDLTTDLDGSPRQIWIVDMGAYESSSLVAASPAAGGALRLHANTPNPFRSTTAIRYDLPRAERVWLGVYDVRGRLVRRLVNGVLQEAGPQAVDWNGRGAADEPLAPGVYFYRLEAGGFADTRRMVLLP